MTESSSGPTGRAGLPVVFLVAQREVTMRLRSRAFQIGTVVLITAIVIGLGAISLLGGQSKPTSVAFAGPAQALASPFEAAAEGLKASVTVSNAASQAQAESDVSAGRLAVLVSGPANAPTVLVKATLDPTIEAVLDATVRQVILADIVARSGLDPAAVAAELAAGKVDVQSQQPPSRAHTQEVIFALVVAYFLFYSLGSYGAFVASGVVEEKSTRIVEIILSTVRPTQLLAGKVLGIGAVGLLQIALVGATGLVMVHVTHVVTVPGASPGAIALDVMWFLLGFSFYATLFAMGGALVSRQEDIQSVVVYPTVFLIAALCSPTQSWPIQPAS